MKKSDMISKLLGVKAGYHYDLDKEQKNSILGDYKNLLEKMSTKELEDACKNFGIIKEEKPVDDPNDIDDDID